MKGDEGKQLWIRRHAKWRERLFTPTKVVGGRRGAAKLQGHRFTCGRYINGKQFTMLDDWKSLGELYRRLREPGIGRIVFCFQSV